MLDDIRHGSVKKMYTLLSIPQVQELYFTEIHKAIAIATMLYNLDASVTIKMNVGIGLFASTIVSLGTERHSELLKDVFANKVYIKSKYT